MNSPQNHVEKERVLALAFRDYEKSLYEYCLFKIRNLALAQDLVQETFLKTWRYLARGGNIVLMRAFLYRVMNCLIIDEYRKRKMISLDALLENGFEVEDKDSDKLIDALDGQLMIMLIDKLPKKYRSLLTMRYPKEMTIAEISAITNQSKNAVSVQVYRGLRKIEGILRK